MLLEKREASGLLWKVRREAGMEFPGHGLELGVLGGWTGRDGGPHAGRLQPVGTSAAPSGEKVPILEMKSLDSRFTCVAGGHKSLGWASGP